MVFTWTKAVTTKQTYYIWWYRVGKVIYIVSGIAPRTPVFSGRKCHENPPIDKGKVSSKAQGKVRGLSEG